MEEDPLPDLRAGPRKKLVAAWAERSPGLLESDTDHDAFDLFIACRTQWRAGLAGPYGLDYGAVAWVSGVLGIDVDEGVLRGVQALEDAYLSEAHGDRQADRDGRVKVCRTTAACEMCGKKCPERMRPQAEA